MWKRCRSQGITVIQFRMLPCGENLPHTHPRATELLSMISGGPLQAGFVDTKGEHLQFQTLLPDHKSAPMAHEALHIDSHMQIDDLSKIIISHTF